MNKKVAEYKETYKKLAVAKKRGIITENTYANALAKLNPRYQEANKQLEKQLQLQGKINKSKSKMKEWGAAALAFSSVAYKMLSYSTAAIDFESAMADVRKVVNFDTPQQFKEMGKDILEMSTRIPIAAEGLAAIVASGGQSGIARKDLLSFAESAAKMGVAFDITADQAGEMMAKWRTAFKMGQPEVVELADKINYLSNNTAATAPLISDVVTRVGPLGAVGGVASGEIAALGASIVGVGINSEMGATGIKNLILALVSGESATKSQANAFAALGLDATEMAAYMQRDAKGAILTILDSLKNLDKVRQASVLQELFGKESLGAISPLLSNLDELKKNFAMVADKGSYANSMEGEFQEKAKTTANSIKLMNNSMEALKVSLADGLLPIIKPLAEGIGSFAKKIQELAKEYPNLTAGAIGLAVGFVGVATVVSGLGFAISGISMALATASPFLVSTGELLTGWGLKTKAAALLTQGWTAAQWLFNASLSATGSVLSLLRGGVTQLWGILAANPWIIAATLAIGAAVLIYQNWDTIKQWFITLWDNPMLAIEQFWTGLKNIFQSGFDWVSAKWQALGDSLSTPIFGKVNIATGGTGAAIAQNANGGIYGPGAFLTTFAEKTGESAIPHTPTPRNIGLLARTNAIMGNPLGLGRTGGGVKIEAPISITVQGSADDTTVQKILQGVESRLMNLKKELADMSHQNARVNYA
ncbi:MAG: phage tail tape measure protein [Acidaminococcaceae bacterium]